MQILPNKFLTLPPIALAIILIVSCGSGPKLTLEEAILESQLIIEELMEEKGYPGLSITVGHKVEIIWSQGFGYANLESMEVVDPAFSKFRIGSVSKPITAFAVGLLVQEGKLDLDAPIQQYVPSFPAKPWPITTRQLAGHLGGIRHYEDIEKEVFIETHYNSVTESLSVFEDDPLLNEPGTEFSYSSYGWNLISAAIEGASGQDFLGYMQEQVFSPLELTNTMPDEVQSEIGGKVAFYDMIDGKPTLAKFTDNSYKWASGGFLSTTDDLVLFAFAHIQPTLLKQETVDLLWTPVPTKEGKTSYHCIGWGGGTNSRGVRMFGHRGGSVGGTTNLTVYPDLELSCALAVNVTEAETDELFGKILRMFRQAVNNQG